MRTFFTTYFLLTFNIIFSQTNVIINGDFENNLGSLYPWIISNKFWNFSLNPCSNTYFALTADGGGYAYSYLNDEYISQTVQIPQNSVSGSLNFCYKINTDNINSGVNLVVKFGSIIIGNYNYANSNNTWQTVSIPITNISSYSGSQVSIDFFANESSANSYWGKVYIDNVSLYVTTQTCSGASISSQPQNQSANIGSSTSFTVSVNGTAPFNYTWYKNGSIVSTTSNSSNYSNTYYTPALNSGDQGNNYYCVVTNCNGSNSQQSNSAFLSINSTCSGASISSQPQNQSANIGSSTSFTVSVNGTAPFNYTWYKNGSIVSTTSNSSNYSNTYYTPALNSGDQGNNYYCVVTNCNGSNSQQSNSAFLSLNVGTPNIEVDKQNLIFYQHFNREGLDNFIYPITESEINEEMNNLNSLSSILVSKRTTEDWRNRMIGKYGLNRLNSIDWSFYDSPINDQKSCGSCWAFCASSHLENLANQNNLMPFPDFSEQQLVSCVPNTDCIAGGWYFWAFDYIQESSLTNENCYPYIENNGMCSDLCQNPDYKINISQFTGPLWGEDPILSDLKLALNEGPLSVSFNMTDDFLNYSGGILNSSSNLSGGKHAVLLVGYNDDLQYFKIKNSWGPDRGENGYYRISYNDVTDLMKFGGYASSANGVYIEDNSPITFQEIEIKNTGNALLNIESISSNKPWITVDNGGFSINSGESRIINISINDWNLVSSLVEIGEVTINSNDVNNSSLKIIIQAFKSTSSNKPQALLSSSFYQDRVFAKNVDRFPLDIKFIGAEVGVKWNLQSTVPWLTVSSTTGSQEERIEVSCNQNNDGDSRIGFLILSSSDVSNSPQVYKVVQGINNAPIVFDGNVNVISNEYYFSKSDFLNSYYDFDGDELKGILIKSFPSEGMLTFNNTPVVFNQRISVDKLTNLKFEPDISWSGFSTFDFSIDDGVNSSLNVAPFNIRKLTNVDQDYTNNLITIFPSPVNDMLLIKHNDITTNMEYEIYGLNGSIIKVGNSNISSPINVAELFPGIYFIKIVINEIPYYNKFIKN